VAKTRPDVTNYFKTLNLNLDGSGFIARIPERKLQTAPIGLAYTSLRGYGSLEYADKALVKSQQGIQLSLPTSSSNNYTASGIAEHSLWRGVGATRIGNEDKLVEIPGWAFIKGQSAAKSRIYLVLRSDTQTYVSIRYVRRDLM